MLARDGAHCSRVIHAPAKLLGDHTVGIFSDITALLPSSPESHAGMSAQHN